MASPYTVNIQMSMGVDFSQDFYLTNPDLSPMDITGCKFTGALSKWAGSYNAVESTSSEYKYKSVPFVGSVANGVGGVYNLSMDGALSMGLEEGKYVYTVVMEDVNGTKRRVLDGVVFLDYTILP